MEKGLLRTSPFLIFTSTLFKKSVDLKNTFKITALPRLAVS